MDVKAVLWISYSSQKSEIVARISLFKHVAVIGGSTSSKLVLRRAPPKERISDHLS